MAYDKEKIWKRIDSEKIKLKNYYKNQGKSIDLDFYNDIGWGRDTFFKYKKELKIPPLDVVVNMCNLFHCELGFLLCEEGYTLKKRSDIAIQKATGLSDKAIYALRSYPKVNSSINYILETEYNNQSITEYLLSVSSLFDDIAKYLCSDSDDPVAMVNFQTSLIKLKSLNKNKISKIKKLF